jgi:choice-of-anchor B domain-containing protein
MIRLFLFCLFLGYITPMIGQQSQNMTLLAHIDRGDTRYSGSWIYTKPNGEEYALLGAKTGTAIYAMDGPQAYEELAFIPGPETNWREITVVGDYAYVVTDVQGSNHSMHVIDLTQLPNTATLLTTYDATFDKGHIIQKDIFEEAPYVYVSGTTTTEGVHILDVSNPANPFEIGVYNPGYYIHDCHVRGDRMFAAAFFEETVDIVDISDKTQPTIISRISYPGTNTHSFTTTIDEQYLFIADEQDGTIGRIWNIEDLDNPFEVATYTANLQSLVHNPYMAGDFVTISHNTEGLRILDMVDPEVPVEVAFYDTFDGVSGGFKGLWSACPYSESGKIIGGDRTEGLFVWAFDTVYAGRFYVTVVDSITGAPIQNAITAWNGDYPLPPTDIDGRVKGGALPGSFELIIGQAGYVPKSVPVVLAESAALELTVELVPDDFTNTNEAPEKPAFSFYPNPWVGEGRLECTIDAGIPLTLQLFDVYGRVVQAWAISSGSVTSLPQPNVGAGMYFLILKSEEGAMLGLEKVFIE